MTLKLPAGHFLGQTLRMRELHDLTLIETTYSADLKLPKHCHEMAKYCFVLKGSFSETIGSREQVRHPLALTFHPADTTHSEVHNAPGHHFLIEVGPPWLDRMIEYAAVLDRPVDLEGTVALRLATQLYDEFRHLDWISPLAIEGLILELMAGTSRLGFNVSERRPPPWLNGVEELLRAKFTENLTLNELATTAGVHKVHLARVFRKFHGCSIGHFVRQLRVEYASQQLSSTDVPLVDIAAASGFSDQSHFSRVFKSFTRMLPSDFRAVFRQR